MPSLSEIPNTDDLDEAERWAVWEEFNLRYEAWQQQLEMEKHGVVGAFKRLARVMVGEEGGAA